MFKKNVDFLPYKSISAWRKIAIGTWPNPGDPSVYALIEVDAGPLLEKIQDYKSRSIRVTPTTVIAKALAVSFRSYPKINSILRFGRLYQRKDINIFLQVSADNQGENLSGMVVQKCDSKSLEEIAKEVGMQSSKIKGGDDVEFKKVKNMLSFMPGILMAPLLKVMGFILYSLNLWAPFLNTPRDGFGSAMVTSVGMLGIEHAFAPLVPYSRCPVLVAVGEITYKPMVVDDKIVIRPVIPLSATIDHRVVDGVACSKMLKSLKEYLKNPF